MTISPKARIGAGAAAVALLVMLGAGVAGAAAPTLPQRLSDQLANCQDDQAVTQTPAEKTWALRCVTLAQRAIDTWNAAHPAPTPTSSSSASPSPTVAPTTSSAPPTPTMTPSPQPSPTPTIVPSPKPTPTPSGRTCPAFPAMPDASCTGVPAGVVLHSCSGTISASGTYDSCLFSGDLFIQAKNITVTRSRVLGKVTGPAVSWAPGVIDFYDSSRNLKLVDVEVDGSGITDSSGPASIGQDGWSCLRCNVHGQSGRGASIGSNVSIVDSWFHDFRQPSSDAHMSAAGSNGGSHNVIQHTVLDCPVQACSGALVAYGDFDPVGDWLITQNLFNSPGSYCLYAGSTPGSGKPYPVATNIRVIDNLWGRKYLPVFPPGQTGPSGYRCGLYGPVSPGTWPSAAPSVWTGNRWQDGSGAVNP